MFYISCHVSGYHSVIFGRTYVQILVERPVILDIFHCFSSALYDNARLLLLKVSVLANTAVAMFRLNLCRGVLGSLLCIR